MKTMERLIGKGIDSLDEMTVADILLLSETNIYDMAVADWYEQDGNCTVETLEKRIKKQINKILNSPN